AGSVTGAGYPDARFRARRLTRSRAVPIPAWCVREISRPASDPHGHRPRSLAIVTVRAHRHGDNVVHARLEGVSMRHRTVRPVLVVVSAAALVLTAGALGRVALATPDAAKAALVS